MTDTYYNRNKERILEQQRLKRLNDPEWRESRIAYNKQYNIDRREIVQASRKAWVEANPSWTMFKNARARSKQFNVPFDIKYTDIIIPTHCPILGIPLDRNTPESAPSLDRIIPERGYVLGNICVISSKANRMKQDCSVGDLERIVTYIKSFHPA